MSIRDLCRGAISTAVSVEEYNAVDLADAYYSVESIGNDLDTLLNAATALEQFQLVADTDSTPIHAIALESIVYPLNLEVGLESVAETAKAIWDRIVAFLQKLYEGIKNFYKKLVSSLFNNEKKIETVDEFLKNSKDRFKRNGEKKTLSLNKSMFSTKGRFPIHGNEIVFAIKDLIQLSSQLGDREIKAFNLVSAGNKKVIEWLESVDVRIASSQHKFTLDVNGLFDGIDTGAFIGGLTVEKTSDKQIKVEMQSDTDSSDDTVIVTQDDLIELLNKVKTLNSDFKRILDSETKSLEKRNQDLIQVIKGISIRVESAESAHGIKSQISQAASLLHLMASNRMKVNRHISIVLTKLITSVTSAVINPKYSH